MKRLAILILLAACSPMPDAAPDVPPDATASITVSSGGMLGQSATQIFGDDRVVTTGFNYGRATKPTEQTIPGAYTRAAAVIRASGRQAKAHVKTDVPLCMDYGADTVQATPPIGGFDAVTTGCPDEAVTTLLSNVLAAIVPPR